MRRLALLAALALGCAACDGGGRAAAGPAEAGASDAGSSDAAVAAEDRRGARYCEVLLAYLEAGIVEVQVWGTQGLNDCPSEAWEALDAEQLRAEFEATRVIMNGPRHWLIDAVEAEMLPDVPSMMFGDLEMRQLATLQLDPSTVDMRPYTERIVNRTTRFTFREGSEIYELLSADGSIYVMQSYALIVDPALSESELATLGARLQLPSGWEYRARVLDADLEVRAEGQAFVLQDELQNTYQRYQP